MLQNRTLVPTLPAADLERAKRFYADKLGLLPDSENPSAIEYSTSCGKFGLYRTESAGKAEHTIAAWEVDDIAAVVAQLRARGVVFEDYDYPELKTVDGIAVVGSQLAAWFRDSEGNILALVQPHARRPGRD